MTKARDLANIGTTLASVSTTELGYLDGVTSAIQTQIDGKQAVVSGVNSTEIGYLDGVTSAIQTQLDGKTAKSTLTTTGDIYYASSANTPARLGIGSTGQVLTVASGIPSWATTTSSSGLVFIERATFTSTTSIISGSVFSSTYDNYLILITVNSASTLTPAFEMRMRTGSTTTTTGYTFAQANASSSGTASQYGSGNTTAWDLTSGETSNGSFIRMHMANPYASDFTHFNAQNDWTQSSTSMQVRNQAGFLNNTTSYDKFDIIAQYNVTGFYAVYGFAKS